VENIAKILPDIAALDERIELQSFTTAADSYGGLTKTWATYATAWARIEYSATTSGEDYANHVNLSVLRIGFTCRWRDGVTVKDRVKYNDEYYDIVKIETMGRRKFLKITADRKQ
jgi:SPP1 family predicted phage head-tail adaptor